MIRAARGVLWISAAAGVFLAFFWPLVFGPDPSSETFHAAAIATLLALLASITAIVVAKR